MDVLIAIAALCQVSSNHYHKTLDAYQLNCQKQYVECYFKGDLDLNTKAVSTNSARQKLLKDCVLERAVKCRADSEQNCP